MRGLSSRVTWVEMGVVGDGWHIPSLAVCTCVRMVVAVSLPPLSLVSKANGGGGLTTTT